MIIDRILELLKESKTKNNHFPPTDLFNEGWMLRIVLDWFDRNKGIDHFLSIPEDGKWYSEALLPSAFLHRSRTDSLAERHTHADGVIGHFDIGSSDNKGELSLISNSSHFVVLEAKMFSKLSPGTKNAPNYDQAARNVACIAHILEEKINPDRMKRLGFAVLAPIEQIERGEFAKLLSEESIRQKVDDRVKAYKGEKDDWFQKWFIPTLKKIEIKLLSWEEILNFISNRDSIFYKDLKQFYDDCLEFNKNLSYQESNF